MFKKKTLKNCPYCRGKLALKDLEDFIANKKQNVKEIPKNSS